MESKSYGPILRWLGILLACWIILCGVAVAILFAAFHNIFPRDAPSSYPSTRTELISRLPYKEVTVPFNNHKGQIFAKAALDGVPMECLVDTGVSCIEYQDLPL